MQQNILNKKIGIIGGGQLGKMMILEAKKMGLYVIILDPVEHCPAHSISDEHIIADFDNEKEIKRLASLCDVVTYEFEHIDAKTLLYLENNEVSIYPTAKSLTIIQNKLLQKQELLKNKVLVPEFMPANNIKDIKEAGGKFGYPFILKTCTGGYDGKGNYVVYNENDIEKAYEALGAGKLPNMAEKFIDFSMEISVLACRGIDGEIVVYPVAENIHKNNILEKTKVPANISESISQSAMQTASKVMEIFNGVGMFCIEMFVSRDGSIFVNEVAPRPHNSGHYTIEACVTSQFENHIRAVCGIPLGDSSLIRPVVMRNILGEEGHDGRAEVNGVSDALQIREAKLHIYGKEFTKPKRKMGHLTVIANTVENAEQLADKAFGFIKVISEKN